MQKGFLFERSSSQDELGQGWERLWLLLLLYGSKQSQEPELPAIL